MILISIQVALLLFAFATLLPFIGILIFPAYVNIGIIFLALIGIYTKSVPGLIVSIVIVLGVGFILGKRIMKLIPIGFKTSFTAIVAIIVQAYAILKVYI